jgi:hypothetical protein
VLLQTFLEILSVTDVYLIHSLGADHVHEIHSLPKMAPEVGFEPTIRRGGLTAENSPSEIFSPKKCLLR